jgi:hypothetical protein
VQSCKNGGVFFKNKKREAIMKKIISIIAFLSFAFAGVIQAQEQEESSNAPKQHDFTVSVNFGIGSHLGKIDAPKPDLPEYSLSAPMTAWFEKKPVLDIEGRWFFLDKWALKLTGGFSLSYNPGYYDVPGVQKLGKTKEDFELGDIPTYNQILTSDNIQYSVGLGVDRYFTAKSDRLYLRIGLEGGFAYARTSVKDKDGEFYLGAAVGEAYAFRAAPVTGLDYFFTRQLFVGIDIRPVAYQYSIYSQRPQVGLPSISSDNHSFSFIAQPTLKLGFRF